MSDRIYKIAGHLIRWFLELAIIWIYVLPETGTWTCFVLTMITVGIEWDHMDWEIWRKS